MANDFFRNSIPSSVPKHYIAYGNKKNQMSNALFLVYFSTVNGVEALGEVSGGRLAPKDSGASCAPWDSRRGCCAGLCTNSGTLSVGSSSQKTLSSSMLPWTLNAARGRAFPSLVSRVLTDGGRTSGTAGGRRALVWPGGELSGHRLAPGLHAQSRTLWISSASAPSQGKPGILFIPPAADGRALGASWGGLCSARLTWQGGDMGGQCRVCCGVGVCQPQGLERVHAH